MLHLYKIMTAFQGLPVPFLSNLICYLFSTLVTEVYFIDIPIDNECLQIGTFKIKV